MEGLYGVLVIGGMIVLRLIVPLGIMLALGYALHRLDTKWHPETTSAA
jgi:hypothetical protein